MKKENKKEPVSHSIIIDMPDDIKYAPKPVQDKWLQWRAADDEQRNHPDRFYHIINRTTGEPVTLDLLGLKNVIENICKKNGVKRVELAQIIEKHAEFHARKIKKSQIMREWKTLLYGSLKASKKDILDLEAAKIIDLFGKFHTVEEVWKIINQQMGYNCDITRVRKFKSDNEVVISQKRAAYVLKRQDFRLATETGRLEELSEIYYALKQKFEETNRLEYSRELRNIIDSIRKEVKGDELKLTIDGKIDINATIQANKNVLDIAKRMPIHMLIIGLVAAKQNVDPTQMMASLATGHYAKLNGFNGMVDETPREIIYPSSIIKSYDWGEIRRLAADESSEEIIPLTPSITYTDKDLQEKARKRKESVQEVLRKWEEVQKNKVDERDKRDGKGLHTNRLK